MCESKHAKRTGARSCLARTKMNAPPMIFLQSGHTGNPRSSQFQSGPFQSSANRSNQLLESIFFSDRNSDANTACKIPLGEAEKSKYY